MAYLATGIIVKIEQTTSNTITNSYGETKTYLHRKIVIDTTKRNVITGERSIFENYPCFDFSGDNCAKLDSFQQGQEVNVYFDLKGVRYNDKQTGEEKFFTSLVGFGIGAVDNTQQQQQPQDAPQPQQQYTQPIPPQYAPQDYNPMYKGNQTVKPQDIQQLYPQPQPQETKKQPLKEEDSDLPF